MTYRELNKNERGWIASHVATDLLMMHEADATVSAFDMAKIEDARKRDAAIATLPKESNFLPRTSR